MPLKKNDLYRSLTLDRIQSQISMKFSYLKFVFDLVSFSTICFDLIPLN